MSACLSCLREVSSGASYHRECLTELFGKPAVPQLEVQMATLHSVGLEIAGKVALSGVQRKLAMRLSDDGTRLVPAPERSRYILKPPPQTFPSVPENEHVTMRLAKLCGIAVPPCALIRLADGALAFMSRRFDRTQDGRKLRMEDFCQLSETPSKDRYTGSAELCARVLRRYASEPIIEAVKLFRLFAFAWWVGNGDLHLKNLSLLTGEDGLHRLSPAYDLLNTQLVLGEDELALAVGGKKRNLTRRLWLDFGTYCGIPPKVVTRELQLLAEKVDPARELLAASALPEQLRELYAQGLVARADVLGR